METECLPRCPAERQYHFPRFWGSSGWLRSKDGLYPRRDEDIYRPRKYGKWDIIMYNHVYHICIIYIYMMIMMIYNH